MFHIQANHPVMEYLFEGVAIPKSKSAYFKGIFVFQALFHNLLLEHPPSDLSTNIRNL